MQSGNIAPSHSGTRQFEDAYREFIQNVNALIDSTSLQQPLVAAYGEYGRALQAAINGETVQGQATEAYGNYLQVLQQAITQPSIRQGSAEAFQQYLAATRQAWSDLEVETLDPLLLVGIAQSMMFAAAVASGNVAPNWTAPASSPLAWEASM